MLFTVISDRFKRAVGRSEPRQAPHVSGRESTLSEERNHANYPVL